MTAPRLLSINNYHYRRGGAEAVYLAHNSLFEENGWDVVPFAMRHPENLPAASARHFVDEIEFGHTYGPLTKLKNASRVVYSFQARARIADLIRETPPRIAHAHNVYHHISPAIFPVLRKAGIPVAMTVHDLKIACPAYTMMLRGSVCEQCRGGRIYNVAANRCIKGSLALSSLVMLESALHRMMGLYESNVSRFVAPSRFFIDKLAAWGWSRDRFAYIPNFVESEQFVPAVETGKGFVYVGRLSPEKGIDTLIRAAARARQPLAIVGTGAEEKRLRQLAVEEGADVTFLGYRTGSALHDAIRSARAVVLPSIWYENAPISILEAYALGRPVIGSDIGGIPELIRDGETGAIVPPGDADTLAAVLARFAAEPPSRLAAMGRAGRALVETEFGRTLYRERMIDLYATLERSR